jgi:hypothetical protein
MTFWVAGATVASSLIGANASRSAASAQSAAADRAAQLQREQFDITNEQQRPYREAGGRALTRLESLAEYKPFDMATFAQDPSYQFRLDQGTKALERSAAARGGLISGNTGGALQNYGQGLASQEYSNAFNRYQTERNATLEPYMTLAGFGRSANALSAQAGQNYATNAGNMLTSGAAAQAAGGVGMANAVTGGLNQYLSYTGNNNLANALRGNNSIGYGSGYSGGGPTGYNP